VLKLRALCVSAPIFLKFSINSMKIVRITLEGVA
jgi:hypothetical protein